MQIIAHKTEIITLSFLKSAWRPTDYKFWMHFGSYYYFLCLDKIIIITDMSMSVNLRFAQSWQGEMGTWIIIDFTLKVSASNFFKGNNKGWCQSSFLLELGASLQCLFLVKKILAVGKWQLFSLIGGTSLLSGSVNVLYLRIFAGGTLDLAGDKNNIYCRSWQFWGLPKPFEKCRSRYWQDQV